MTTFTALRDQLPADPHKRGKQFEQVCKWFLKTDPRYSNRLAKVWLSGRRWQAHREGVVEPVGGPDLRRRVARSKGLEPPTF